MPTKPGDLSRTNSEFRVCLRACAKTGRPTDTDQRLIRIGEREFVHPPRLVFGRLLKFARRSVDLLEVEIEPKRVSARRQPSLDRVGQMEISALRVRQHAIGVGLSRSWPFAVRARKAQPIVEPLRRIEVVTRQDRDQGSGRTHSCTPNETGKDSRQCQDLLSFRVYRLKKSPRRISPRGLNRIFDDAIVPVFCPTCQRERTAPARTGGSGAGAAFQAGQSAEQTGHLINSGSKPKVPNDAPDLKDATATHAACDNSAARSSRPCSMAIEARRLSLRDRKAWASIE